MAHHGEIVVGPRVSPGLFTQLNARPDFARRKLLEIVVERLKAMEAAMQALARHGLADAANRSYETLSGGEKARLEILCLEAEGHNLLLLDEPTDNLDVDSSEALESALEGFEGTVVAVSHDRTSCAAWTAFCCSTTTAAWSCSPTPALRWRRSPDLPPHSRRRGLRALLPRCRSRERGAAARSNHLRDSSRASRSRRRASSRARTAYHCHILAHEHNGMMGTVRVEGPGGNGTGPPHHGGHP